MKALLINSVCGIGSTGRICTDLAQQLEAEGYEVQIAYGRKGTVPQQFRKYAVRIGTDFDCRMHAVRTRLFDAHGFGSKRATRQFLAWAEAYKPDLLWLHNLHGYYINVEMLFDWIKRHPEMQVKWTLHDCWAFTGHCAHFTAARCTQWKDHCRDCPQLRCYPACVWKGSVSKNFERKRKAFTGVRNMTLITPSRWLADLTRQSFLKDYSVEVRYNTIDTTVFRPTQSDFRERAGLQDRFIVLGVANVWDERKGLFDFYRLAGMLDDRYAIVLVGLNGKQIKKLPGNIRGIQRTNSPRELAAIYSAADAFVNPTYEDNYPTVNLEAQACGTPVITYDTGGCKETLHANDASVVRAGDIQAVAELLRKRYESTVYGEHPITVSG